MVFQLLARTPVTSSELAERLGVTKQAAGQLVDDLERRGYVRRDPHPAGGRRKLLVLTDAARAHLAVMRPRPPHPGGRTRRPPGGRHPRPLRTGLAALIRTLTGDDLPPLRPVW